MTNQITTGEAGAGTGMSYTTNMAYSSKSVEWFTPECYVEAARRVLGFIDLDPASCKQANAWINAVCYYTALDNGLTKPWGASTIWLNPPFNMSSAFAARMVHDYQLEVFGQGILLCKFVPNYEWFQQLKQFPMVVTSKRVSFWKAYQTEGDSRMDGAICFVYFGPNKDKFYQEFKQFGDIVTFS